ncbi:sigma 54-interacting transcriptional regulator [Candidatus Formimonas warabiya]|uniref:sigma 54-interacting transcriptional regulator n=1 Tax=Formimonas warabiya TaxID=1761012 RepID=UPI0011D08837|nr:sigma 54-interacting transcriptional regulator [Candidatus Formimonas warabiya]
MENPRLKINFKDRVGFVFDVSRVIFNWGINILSLEIQTGCLYLHIEKIDAANLKKVIDEIKLVPGVTGIDPLAMMPAEEREFKIKAVLDSVSEGIIAVNERGMITAFNPAAEHILKVSASEVAGKNIKEAISADVLITGCLDEGKSYNYQKVSLPIPQGRVSLLSSGRPLKDEQGNIVGAVICIKDMSDVKRLVYTVTGPQLTTFSDIWGNSESLKKVLDLGKIVAKGDSTVLIRGESGTGKELFARAIHMESFRRGKPFVPINCAALPENLLESELFGYVEGAFTGASKGGKTGLIEYAHNGTLFLDEIGELSPRLQVKLLRVLQEGQVRKIGDRKEHPVNIRIIAATNRNLEEMMKMGTFREDLYYRLNVVPIFLPPLRQRKEDIALLARHLIKKFNTRLNKRVDSISEEAVHKLMAYHWPGNVRELENVLERAMILTPDEKIITEHVVLDYFGDEKESRNPREELGAREETWPWKNQTLEQVVGCFERKLLLQALKEFGGVRRTAKALGVSHTTILNKIKKYGLGSEPS